MTTGVKSKRFWRLTIGVAATLLLALTTIVLEASALTGSREQLIPILGVTMGSAPEGTVAYLHLSFEERRDRNGLVMQFMNKPGRFSRMAQTAVEQAVYRVAQQLNLSTDSWTVVLTVPYEGITVYGDSLSAMVALSVAAMANGEFIEPDRVMTGTVRPDGHIGVVTAVPLKIEAAYEARLQRVIVPEELDVSDPDWRTPFLLQVSPVASVKQAYAALTNHAPVP